LLIDGSRISQRFVRMVIVVIRHSVRQDQEPVQWINWKDKNIRPYDPPIADYILPIRVYQEITKSLPNFNPQKIIMSPFIRCLQTGSYIAKKFHIKKHILDARLSEEKYWIERYIGGKKLQNKPHYLDFNILTEIILNPFDHFTSYIIHDSKRSKEIKQDLLIFFEDDKINANENSKIIDINEESDNNDEYKANEKEIKIENDKLDIEWKHKEPFGTTCDITLKCFYEYLKHEEDMIFISHGAILRWIYQACDKSSSKGFDYCGWFGLDAKGNILTESGSYDF